MGEVRKGQFRPFRHNKILEMTRSDQITCRPNQPICFNTLASFNVPSKIIKLRRPYLMEVLSKYVRGEFLISWHILIINKCTAPPSGNFSTQFY